MNIKFNPDDIPDKTPTGGGNNTKQQQKKQKQQQEMKEESKEIFNKDQQKKTDVRYRQFYDDVRKIIEQSDGDKKQQMLQELRRQIKQTYFSQAAIIKQMKYIAVRLFYYPSLQLSQKIVELIDMTPEVVIRNCVTLRHGDLLLLKNRIVNNTLQDEIDHVMQSLVGWGPYMFDIMKLQQMATNKSGNVDDKQYTIDDMQLQIRIAKQYISVKHKGKQISPSHMKNGILRQMAIQRLRRKATTVFYDVLISKGYLI